MTFIWFWEVPFPPYLLAILVDCLASQNMFTFKGFKSFNPSISFKFNTFRIIFIAPFRSAFIIYHI